MFIPQREHVSHPYKTNGTVVLHALMFSVLYV